MNDRALGQWLKSEVSPEAGVTQPEPRHAVSGAFSLAFRKHGP